MLYLALALYAEGPTDYAFLTPLLYRLADDLCVRLAPGLVDAGLIEGIDAPPAFRGQGRAVSILEAVRERVSYLDVVFVHADANGDPDRALAERVRPAAELIRDALGWSERRVVPLVPVREVETWMLADGDALRAVFRTRLADAGLGLPTHAQELEHITDPKQALASAARTAGCKAPAARLDELGRCVRLERLRLLPVFQRFEADLLQALRELRFVP